jgi:hypothetical protein
MTPLSVQLVERGDGEEDASMPGRRAKELVITGPWHEPVVIVALDER